MKLKPAAGTIFFLLLAIIPAMVLIISALLGAGLVWLSLTLFEGLRWLDTHLCEYDENIERLKRREHNETDL